MSRGKGSKRRHRKRRARQLRQENTSESTSLISRSESTEVGLLARFNSWRLRRSATWLFDGPSMLFGIVTALGFFHSIEFAGWALSASGFVVVLAAWARRHYPAAFESESPPGGAWGAMFLELDLWLTGFFGVFALWSVAFTARGHTLLPVLLPVAFFCLFGRRDLLEGFRWPKGLQAPAPDSLPSAASPGLPVAKAEPSGAVALPRPTNQHRRKRARKRRGRRVKKIVFLDAAPNTVANSGAQEFVCQYCGAGPEAGLAVPCPRCESPHHEDCWAELTSCSTYGCEYRFPR